MRIAEHVRAMTPYTPGEQPKDRTVIKLNTNENPYLPSPKIKEVLSSFDLDRLRRYPDPLFTDLRNRLAAIWHTKPKNIFVGNGSDEVLSLAARAFVEDDEAIGSFNPSYSLYRTLADIRHVPFVPSNLTPDFQWTNPVVKADWPVALFLLTNPNAPTSVQYPKEKIADFAKRFKGVLIVDEAYADFAKENCVDLAVSEKNRNLLVMRTFSKSFSLAGLRLGYCIGPVDLIEALYKVKDSYNVDALAQAVALAAANDLPWMRANAAKVRKTRARITKELRKRGWDVPDSQSNFVFAKPAKTAAAELFRELRGRHIYVRYFTYPETKDRLRVTIGTDHEMDEFLKAIDELDK